ncbi:MAG: GNAT family N-acetyltransferase [Alistipes sp.]|nr:GNAT family N-acetyltransferase [Alistipes sp.]
MDIKITEIKHYDTTLLQAFERLTPQLSESAPIPTAERLQRIVASPSTHLLAAIDHEDNIVGVLTLVLFDIPTYCKAWIEDVITDSNYRGQGIGRALVERAIEMAKELGADSANLTSRPSREVARALYRKVGFEEVPTTVFRLLLHD